MGRSGKRLGEMSPHSHSEKISRHCLVAQPQMVRSRRVIEAAEDGRGASQLGIRPGRRSLPGANGEV